MVKPVAPLDWDLGNVPPGVAWGGVDEAGRGAWAGPVVAACVLLDPPTVQRWGHVLRGAKDSKKLSPDKRQALAAELKLVLPAWSVAEVDNLTIDRENILQATLAAMRQAISGVTPRPRILFVDGDRAPRSGLPERLLVEGDALSCAVACASILAKTHRDALMVELDAQYVGYGFAAHKGYGTPAHQRALKERGTSAIHRLSYAPVIRAQRADAQAFEALVASLEDCHSVEALQAWVSRELRPRYGLLRLGWLDVLRTSYAQRMVDASGTTP